MKKAKRRDILAGEQKSLEFGHLALLIKEPKAIRQRAIRHPTSVQARLLFIVRRLDQVQCTKEHRFDFKKSRRILRQHWHLILLRQTLTAQKLELLQIPGLNSFQNYQGWN